MMPIEGVIKIMVCKRYLIRRDGDCEPEVEINRLWKVGRKLQWLFV